MSDDLDPDVREVIRRRITLRERDGHERLLLNHEALHALLDAADDRDGLRAWQERVALAAGIGDVAEGRGVHLEADPDIAAEHMAGLLAVADAHVECPIACDRCGETLADVWCGHCHGSGCGPGTASGAYEECEWCAGAGKVHAGCADLCYAALVAERDALAAAVERVRAIHSPGIVYLHADECGHRDSHTVTEGLDGDLLCFDSPTGDRFCTECAGDRFCTECAGAWDELPAWPCPTIRALDGTDV